MALRESIPRGGSMEVKSEEAKSVRMRRIFFDMLLPFLELLSFEKYKKTTYMVQ